MTADTLSLPFPSDSPPDEQLFEAPALQPAEVIEVGATILRLLPDIDSAIPETSPRPMDTVYARIKDLQLLRRIKANLQENDGRYDIELVNGLARRLIIPSLREAEATAGLGTEELADTSEFEHKVSDSWL